MATALHPSPVPTPTPPTPPVPFPQFPRLRSESSASPPIQRNASTSSSRSTTTTSSTTSSLVAVPMRPPPIETRTAATTPILPEDLDGRVASPPSSSYPTGAGPSRLNAAAGGGGTEYASPQPEAFYGAKGSMRNGPRTGRQSTMPVPPAIITSSPYQASALGPRVASGSGSARGSGSPGLPADSSTSGGGGVGSSSSNRMVKSTTLPNAISISHRAANPSHSPTTPRALAPPWVTALQHQQDEGNYNYSLSPPDSIAAGTKSRAGNFTVTTPRGRNGYASSPSSPITGPPDRGKFRTLSIDAGPNGSGSSGGKNPGRRGVSADRRMSETPQHGVKPKPSINDYILGEELGRGSYSTVIQAVQAIPSSAGPGTAASPRPPRQYAIKVINIAHLVQEKKVKYANIERDALIRLGTPRTASPTTTTSRGHRRGLSGSSTTGTAPGTGPGPGPGPGPGANGGLASTGRRRSNASMASSSGATAINTTPSLAIRRDSAGVVGGSGSVPRGSERERLSIAISDSSSGTALGSSIPLSPSILSGRRPSRSADAPPVVQERSEELIYPGGASAGSVMDSPVLMGMRSKPPSPVKEESSRSHDGQDQEQPVTPAPAPLHQGGSGSGIRTATPTPKKRRQSLAPSERSVKSQPQPKAHPGIIRLYSTFNDSASLYFVLELAVNGELLSYIRKHGSLDMQSTRYYAAQLIDTLEFMHERGIIHRDLKPENILLDKDMRIKITDFGSAKILKSGKEDDKSDEGDKRRSFVGSADFVSPEVLRNEEATLSSDVWAFGCVLFHLITGKPPFRAATDYLTFQRILKKEMQYPVGFDEDAKALVDLTLNLDPLARPTPTELKAHPFFATTDFLTLWNGVAPTMETGLTRPVATLADTSVSDPWAVFDDEVSDGGFEYDRDEELPESAAHAHEPRFDHVAAADAVRIVDRPGPASAYGHTQASISGPVESRYPFQDAGSDADEFRPPRPAYIDASPPPPAANQNQTQNASRKGRSRLDSSGSGGGRTSSSSSSNRNGLSGLLESMRLPSGHGGTSSRNSRTSDRSSELSQGFGAAAAGLNGRGRDSRVISEDVESPPRVSVTSDLAKWSSILLKSERIVYTSSINVRPNPSLHLPAFLLPASKRRQLILTDFPRLITVKEETGGNLVIKGESVILSRGSAARSVDPDSRSGGVQCILEVQDKGPKGFLVQTTTQTTSYTCDTTAQRQEWVNAIKSAMG